MEFSGTPQALRMAENGDRPWWSAIGSSYRVLLHAGETAWIARKNHEAMDQAHLLRDTLTGANTWTPDADMARFTDPEHPHHWPSDDPSSSAYNPGEPRNSNNG